LTDKYNINRDNFFAVIECESNWDTQIQSKHMQNYGQEESYGIAQWHLPDNDITKEQALSPIYSLDRMAKEWSQGYQWKWSCYKLAIK